eukprot:UN30128
MIIGTGVGRGLIINGDLFSGANNMCGEIGHMRMPIDCFNLLDEIGKPMFECKCMKNQKGCVDKYLSGQGFELLYKTRTNKKLTSQEIIKLYEKKDSDAIAHVEMFLEVFT